MVSSDVESLVLVSVEVIQDELVTVEEIAGYFSYLGDV
jgi:hypothetical protein